MEYKYDITEAIEAAQKHGYETGINKTVRAMLNTVYPDRIITSGPATIIFWEDGSKTVVKRRKGDKNDLDAAVAQAIAKQIFVTNSCFHTVVEKAARKGKK